jgi:hypothetical protein
MDTKLPSSDSFVSFRRPHRWAKSNTGAKVGIMSPAERIATLHAEIEEVVKRHVH